MSMFYSTRHARRKVFRKNNSIAGLLSSFIYLIAIIAPIMTLPQLLEVWKNKQAANVSMSTWTTYTLVSFFWLVYGLLHKEKPLVLANSMLFAIDLFIVVGLLLYR
ncbi:hypothetical protein HY358_00585 [Candidatus Roizmanbacteria bacterium]|nr:hypothetical protein [Candidatus Roizmanbacteria bacterium]